MRNDEAVFYCEENTGNEHIIVFIQTQIVSVIGFVITIYDKYLSQSPSFSLCVCVCTKMR